MPSPRRSRLHTAPAAQALLDRVITELVNAPGALDVSRRVRESL